LQREGNGREAVYSNTEETARYLDKNSVEYIGGIFEMCNARLYKFWNDLDTALKTGQPQNEVKHSHKPVFETLYEEPQRLEQFIEAMTGFSRGNFSALADKFHFSRYHTLCAMSADPAAALDSGCKTSTDPLRIVRFAGSRAGRNQGDRARRFV